MVPRGAGGIGGVNGRFTLSAGAPATSAGGSRIIVGLRAEAGAARMPGAARRPDAGAVVSERPEIRGRRAADRPDHAGRGTRGAADRRRISPTRWRAFASDPAVAFAEPDQRVYPHAVASDPLYPSQWYLQGVEAGGH